MVFKLCYPQDYILSLEDPKEKILILYVWPNYYFESYSKYLLEEVESSMESSIPNKLTAAVNDVLVVSLLIAFP